jgi:hypothetical protein
MPRITNLPKNALFFYANDEKDYLKWLENWTRNGWILTSDFRDNTYEAISFINGIVCVLLYEMPKVDQPEDQPPAPEVTDKKIVSVESDQAGQAANTTPAESSNSTS